jgi:acyl carrier protein
MLHSVSDAEVIATIETVVRVVAHNPAIACRPDSAFLTELGLSSLSMVMLLTEVCERLRFNIFNFLESDLAKVATVQDLVVLLKTKG